MLERIEERHHPECNRFDDHDRSGCELSWAELGEWFTVSLNERQPRSRAEEEVPDHD